MQPFASVRRSSPVVRILIVTIALVALGARAQLAPRAVMTAPPASIDLATFIRIGKFNLPEPTRTAPPPNSLLAQEASAVTYDWDTDTLFIVGDGGTSVVQVTKAGALIDSMTLAPGGSPQGTEFYDTEGLTYVGGGQFVLLEERYRQVNLFTYVGGGTLHRSDVQTVKLGTTVGNVGLEGVSYDPFTGGFILVKEKDPQSIFQTGIFFNSGTASNGSPTATSSTDLFPPALASLADFSDVFSLSNLPFLSGQQDFTHLLVLSQESGQIINVDRLGNVSSLLTITADPGSVLGVPDMTMEGLTMDRDGNLYVVNENGGGDPGQPQLWVYAHTDAPNQAPTGVSLGNVVTSLPENTSTAAAVKVADILVADDGLGVNKLTLSGANVLDFQIIGSALFLRAGTVLNAVAHPSYSVIVSVDDQSVGASPDAQVLYQLAITASTGGTASLIISEVAPWSSGNSPQALRVDWFEVTNTGTAIADITGWKMDDFSASFGSSVALVGITKIAPGESVIFMETTDATRAAKATAFLNIWFGGSPPANLQIGNYSGSGVGLSATDLAEGVNLFNAAGVLQASVTFGPSPTGPFPTYDNGAGANNATITTLSANGIGGAFVAANDANEIGSPGKIGPLSTPVVNITVRDASAGETGPDPGVVRVARTGSFVGPLTVSYSIGAGAGQASGADFLPALTNVWTIPAGQAFVDVTLTPLDDALFEGSETLTLTVFDTGSYDVGSPSSVSVTVADNDPPPTITLSAAQTVLWPPTGQMVPDRITGVVTYGRAGIDPGTLAFHVTDSQGTVQPAGPVIVDTAGRFTFTVALEASRRGEDKDGRRYEITVTAVDITGNPVSATVVVTVPHDKGK